MAVNCSDFANGAIIFYGCEFTVIAGWLGLQHMQLRQGGELSVFAKLHANVAVVWGFEKRSICPQRRTTLANGHCNRVAV